MREPEHQNGSPVSRRRSRFLFCIVIPAFLAWIGFVVVETRAALRDNSEVEQEVLETLMSRPSMPPPNASFDALRGVYNYGRYARPIAHPNHAPVSRVRHFFQDKSFVWIGITQGMYHFSVGLLQFHYTAAAVISMYDSQRGASWSLYRDLPFPASYLHGPQLSRDNDDFMSVLSGCANQTDKEGNITICFGHGELMVSINQILYPHDKGRATPELRYGRARLRIECSVDIAAGHFPNLVLPFGPGRAGTVTKFAARMSQSGFFSMISDDEHIRFSGTLAQYSMVSLDYTTGLLQRETRWRWATFSEYVHVPGLSIPYGMHISDTYGFGPSGAGVESSVFSLNAKHEPSFRFLDTPDLRFTKVEPQLPHHQSKWVITGPQHLNITFTPHGAHFHGSVHLYLVEADLWHMWGTFNGTAPQPFPLFGDNPDSSWRIGSKPFVEILHCPGVLEDHYALW